MVSSFGEPFSQAKRNQKRNARTVLRVRRHFQRANARDQRLATLSFPSGPILSRVRCIASFAVVGGSYSERNRSYSSWPPIQYQKNVSS
jgi:hypothetical protein